MFQLIRGSNLAAWKRQFGGRAALLLAAAASIWSFARKRVGIRLRSAPRKRPRCVASDSIVGFPGKRAKRVGWWHLGSSRIVALSRFVPCCVAAEQSHFQLHFRRTVPVPAKRPTDLIQPKRKLCNWRNSAHTLPLRQCPN